VVECYNLAGEAVQGGTEFAAPVRPSDFRPLSSECWTVGSVAGAGVGSVDIPIQFCLRSLWNLGLGVLVVTSMNRMMFNHACLRNHFERIIIVENLVCVCLEDYEKIDHVMWSCERYDSERRQLWNDLRVTGVGDAGQGLAGW
jgi:hypothetical protein